MSAKSTEGRWEYITQTRREGQSHDKRERRREFGHSIGVEHSRCPNYRAYDPCGRPASDQQQLGSVKVNSEVFPRNGRITLNKISR